MDAAKNVLFNQRSLKAATIKMKKFKNKTG
jgi:hypothetical protein